MSVWKTTPGTGRRRVGWWHSRPRPCSSSQPRRLGHIVAAATAVALACSAVLIANAANEYHDRQAKLDRDLAAEHYAIGTWCLSEKLLNEAREQFERALSLDPDHAEARTQLAEVSKLLPKTRKVECEVRTAEGERMKAELLMSAVRVFTPAGLLVIPATDMDLIRGGAAGRPDWVCSDAYVGDCQIGVDSFSAKSRVGIVSIQKTAVKSIRIYRVCKSCDGRGVVAKDKTPCKACGGTGIRPLPPDVTDTEDKGVSKPEEPKPVEGAQ
jgi:hypothetical protein